ncbi:MAG: hypothetical protein R3336_03565 [Phycisphaeraceae bacterium]|nr:hypothetical protein [Phycisphaeraceae bacterium]
MIQAAAIDVGSNGIRMLVASADDQGHPTSVESYREAVRIGQDVFRFGHIGPETLQRAVDALTHFRRIIDDEGVACVRAVATSATREAENGNELVRAVQDATDIRLEVIDGLEEASLIFAAVKREMNLDKGRSVLVDMGGGSVEVTIARKGRPLASDSLPLGPVRLLHQLAAEGYDESDTKKLVKPMTRKIRKLVRSEIKGKPQLCIATGGNPDCLGLLRKKLLGKKKKSKLTRKNLKRLIKTLGPMPIEQRIGSLDLRPDRADLIVIAAHVMRRAMKEVGARKVKLPRVSLREGLMTRLARNVHLKGTSSRFHIR